MADINRATRNEGKASPISTGVSPPSRRLHRLATVRRREGVQRRTVARHLGIGSREVRRQEDETSDLRISELTGWREVLGVPLAELLVDLDNEFSPPVQARAQLLRVMKTAKSILEKADHEQIRRFAQRMIDLLTEVMPELHDVGPWHNVGQRRTSDELGRIAIRPFSEDLFTGIGGQR